MSTNAPKSIAEIDFAGLTKRQYTPSPDCWADQVLYFLMVDRFSDGEEKGGYGDANGQPVTTGATPLATSDDIGSVPYGPWLGEAAGWQGGTLKGLRSKLGYLRRLGVTAIWISPVSNKQLSNQRTTGTAFRIFSTSTPTSARAKICATWSMQPTNWAFTASSM
jgi:hypothetical protein